MEGYYVYAPDGQGLMYAEDGREVCRALFRLAAPVGNKRMQHGWIEGFGRRWESEFDMESTIAPGVRRWVTDAATGERVAAYEYLDRGLFLIHIGMARVEARATATGFVFRRESGAVGALERRDEPEKTVPFEGMAGEKRYNVVYGLGEDGGVLMMMLALPVLRFAI